MKSTVPLGGGGGASDFTDLGDVPGSYVGKEGYVVRVNQTPDALEFGEEIKWDGTDIVIGRDDQSTVAGTSVVMRAPDIAAGGAGNQAGTDLILQGGKGRGTGTPGDIDIKVPTRGVSGDTAQTIATIAKFSDGQLGAGIAALNFYADPGANRLHVGRASYGFRFNSGGVIDVKLGATTHQLTSTNWNLTNATVNPLALRVWGLGTVSTPAVRYFGGGFFSGIYWPAANRVAISTSNTKRFEVGTNGTIYIGNETANSKMVTGVTIKAEPGDISVDELITIKHPDMSHPMTVQTEDDTMLSVSANTDKGGTYFRSFAETGVNSAYMKLGAFGTDATNSTKSAAGIGALQICGGEDDGAGSVGALTAGGIVVSIHNGPLASSGVWHCDESGGTWQKGEARIEGDINHDGTKIGLFSTAPIAKITGFSSTNITTVRSIDCDATTLDEVADFAATLAEDLKAYGLLGA